MSAHGVLASDRCVALAEEGGGAADAAVAVRHARYVDHPRRGAGRQVRLQQAGEHVGPQVVDLRAAGQGSGAA